MKSNHNFDISKNLNKTSNTSILDSCKDMSNKRDASSKNFTKKRESDAKNLMTELLNEISNLVEILNKSELDDFETLQRSKKNPNESKIKSGRSTSMKTSRFLDSTSFYNDGQIDNKQNEQRFTTSSPVPFQIVPPLMFNQNRTHINIHQAEINLDNKKPSLMAKTTFRLYKADLEKQKKHRKLNEEFQLRARSANSYNMPKKVKIIRPYTDVVRLDQQYKLRERVDGQSLTYCQRLKLLQENSSIIFKFSTRADQTSTIKSSFANIEKKARCEFREDFIRNLFKDSYENEKIAENALLELEMVEKNRKKIPQMVDDDYANQFMINGLLNFSLRSDATIASYIDWDQIDQLLLI